MRATIPFALAAAVLIAGCNSNSSSTPTTTATATASAAPTAQPSASLTATPTLAPTPEVTPAATWNLYDQHTSYYELPYANPAPAFGSQMAGASLKVNTTICDGAQNCVSKVVALDTGSRGFWIPASDFTAVPSVVATPGYIFYNSDGLQLQGYWTKLSVQFPDAVAEGGAPGQAVASVPVLLVQKSCSLPGNWPEGSNPALKCVAPSGGQMGIGFDRTGYGTCPQGEPSPAPNQNPNMPSCAAYLAPAPVPAANQDYNPFLNLSAMQNGQMNAGYVLTPNGIELGLTEANTAPDPSLPAPGTYAFEKLVPTGLSQIVGSPSDWQPATGFTTVNGLSYPAGQVVIDIGIGDMLIGPTSPIQFSTSVPNGDSVGINLLGLPAGTVGYSFVTGDGSNPLAPNGGVNYSPYQEIAYPGNAEQYAFSNTGIDALNGFNYLYDAQNGYIGLQLNSTNAAAFLTPTLAARGNLSFPDGFVTNLPVVLLGATVVSTSGTITLNGPVSGAGTFTISGGTVKINCPSVVPQTIVAQGTLAIGSSLGGPVIAQNGASVEQTPNGNCGSLNP